MRPSASTSDLAAVLRKTSAPGFLHKLHHFRLAVRHGTSRRSGTAPMPRATQTSGLEIASHKVYSPGDDLRYLDWNVYSRLDQKLIKTFRAEREAPLHLLIDTSASMGVPVADDKLAFAAGLAAVLAYISLHQNDPVQIVALGRHGSGNALSPVFRHPQRLTELTAFLAQLNAGGPTTVGVGIDAHLRTTRLPGIAVVLSDFLIPPQEYETALDSMRARGYGVAAIRLLGAEERDPGTFPRRARLRDAESGTERTLDLTPAHRDRYATALRDHLGRLKRWCEARNIVYAVADTNRAIEACALYDLPQAGLLQ